mgnify:FL=1
MRYPLFLSDFDGTLVRGDGTVSETTKRAIAAYRAAGGIFAVVTGRGLTSILPRLRELGLCEGLVVAYQGATIADIATGKLVKDDGFSREDALKAARLLEQDGRHVHIYTVDKLYSNMEDDALHMYERICGVKAEIVTDMPLSDLIVVTNLRIIKELAMVNKEDRRPLMEWLTPRLGEGFYVTCSSDFLVEVMPAGQSKAAAVDFLCNYYGIPRERCAAIGDQLNDLPMIARAGGKFSVANAEEILRRQTQVVASVEEDGVAEALAVAMQETSSGGAL